VGISSLVEAGQLDLFEAPAQHRDERLDRVLDRVRSRFGEAALHRGATGGPLRDADWRGEDLRALGRDHPSDPAHSDE
jgi:hypothetical protein